MSTPTRRQRVLRRLSPRERLAAAREDPLGSLIVATLLVGFGLATWRIFPLGQLSAIAALLILGSLAAYGVRQVKRRDRRSIGTLFAAVGIPLLLVFFTVQYFSFSPGAWRSNLWIRPRTGMVDDLLDSGQLHAATREQALALLGPPDREDHSDVTRHESVSWLLRRSRVHGDFWLVGHLGPDGRFWSWNIRAW